MSDVGGFPEVAAHGAGAHVPGRRRRRRSRAALGELLADPAARERSGRGRARRGLRPLLVGSIAAQHIALYEGLLRP